MADHNEMNFQVTALNDLRAQFVQALEADAVAPPQPAARRWTFEWRRVWAVPGIALAVAVIAIAVTTIPWSSNPTVAEATAGIADAALQADFPPDNWFTYTRSRSVQLEFSATPDHAPHYVRSEREAWLSVDRQGIVRTRDLDDATAPPIEYRYPAYRKYRIGAQSYSRAEIDAFAKDPSKLLQQIDEEAASSGPGQAPATRWIIITEALRDLSPPLPPSLRAVLIRDLGTIPGATLLDSGKDPDGRSAVGLSMDERDVRNSVYFDKISSALIYSITVITENRGRFNPRVKAGDTFESFELLESRTTPTVPKN